jgi:hypothetical protein
MPPEEAMKSKGIIKSKQSKVTKSESRDKVRKMRDDFRAAKKIGKTKPAQAEIRSGTRARRRVTKEVLKEFQEKFNG